MKKTISVFLATLACLSVGATFTACGGEQTDASSSAPEASIPNESTPTESTPTESEPEASTPTEDEVFSGISEEEWNAIIAPISFENYTLSQSGYIVQNDGTEMQQDAVIKITADRMIVDMTATTFKQEGATLETPRVDNVVFDFKDPAEIAAQKASYETIFLALLAEYDHYQWSAEENAYVNPTPITLEDIYAGSQALRIDVFMQNGKVYFTEDGKLEKFSCDFQQTTVFDDAAIISTLVITWTFSDYGTTVISQE